MIKDHNKLINVDGRLTPSSFKKWINSQIPGKRVASVVCRSTDDLLDLSRVIQAQPKALLDALQKLRDRSITSSLALFVWSGHERQKNRQFLEAWPDELMMTIKVAASSLPRDTKIIMTAWASFMLHGMGLLDKRASSLRLVSNELDWTTVTADNIEDDMHLLRFMNIVDTWKFPSIKERTVERVSILLEEAIASFCTYITTRYRGSDVTTYISSIFSNVGTRDYELVKDMQLVQDVPTLIDTIMGLITSNSSAQLIREKINIETDFLVNYNIDARALFTFASPDDIANMFQVRKTKLQVSRDFQIVTIFPNIQPNKRFDGLVQLVKNDEVVSYDRKPKEDLSTLSDTCMDLVEMERDVYNTIPDDIADTVVTLNDLALVSAFPKAIDSTLAIRMIALSRASSVITNKGRITHMIVPVDPEAPKDILAAFITAGTMNVLNDVLIDVNPDAIPELSGDVETITTNSCLAAIIYGRSRETTKPYKMATESIDQFIGPSYSFQKNETSKELSVSDFAEKYSIKVFGSSLGHPETMMTLNMSINDVFLNAKDLGVSLFLKNERNLMYIDMVESEKIGLQSVFDLFVENEDIPKQIRLDLIKKRKKRGEALLRMAVAQLSLQPIVAKISTYIEQRTPWRNPLPNSGSAMCSRFGRVVAAAELLMRTLTQGQKGSMLTDIMAQLNTDSEFSTFWTYR